MTRIVREVNEPEVSASVVARLQALARDHREGLLSLDAYRKLRAALIDALDPCHTGDPQSCTIPHLERAHAVPVPAPPEAVATAQESARRRGLGRVFAWAAAVFRR